MNCFELRNDKMNHSNSKDAESVRSGLSHVTSQPALLPTFRDPGGTQVCTCSQFPSGAYAISQKFIRP